MSMFKLLDTLKPTAAGLDGTPAWFLRLGAPIFAAPLCQLFNHSLATGGAPSQRKTAVITPIAKVPRPTKPNDFRPISVTPVLSRSVEKYYCTPIRYPALRQPSTELNFDDQFAFRPTGSRRWRHWSYLTTYITGSRISSVIDVTARDYAGQCSPVADIKASVIQGWDLGPASYIVTAADLHRLTTGNRIAKFADDTYLVVQASNSSSRLQEIAHIQAWAAENNLKLNCSNSKEIVFIAKGMRGKSAHSPSPCLDIERVNSLGVPGIITNDQLTATDHVSNIMASCNSLHCGFCAATASKKRRCMMFSARPSS